MKRLTMRICSVAIGWGLLTTAGCSWHQPSGGGSAQQAKSVNQSGSNPAAQPTLRASQKLGISVLTALNAALKNPRISVGTTQNAIILTGTVNSEAERKRAVAIAKQKGPKLKLEDHLKVEAAKSAKPIVTNQTTNRPVKQPLNKPAAKKQ